MGSVCNRSAAQWVLLLLLVAMATQAIAEEGEYEFPVLPGSEEWAAMSWDDKVAAVTVPEGIVTKMPTEDLVTTCMRHPFTILFLAANTSVKGFESILYYSNCFRELEGRVDSGHVLAEKYMSIDPDGFDLTWSVEERKRFMLDLSILELALSRPAVLSVTSDTDRLRLLHYCASKLETRFSWDRLTKETFSILVARLLDMTNAVDPIDEDTARGVKLREFVNGEIAMGSDLENIVRSQLSKLVIIQYQEDE